MARRSLSRHRRQAALLALLFGISAGLATASVAAADRVGGAYDRLREDVDAPDFFFGEDPELPGVERVVAIDSTLVILSDASGRSVALGQSSSENCSTGVGEISAVSTRSLDGSEPPSLVRVVRGRLPAATAVDEIAVPLITSKRAGIDVGDRLNLQVCGDGGTGDALEVTVVGVTVGLFDAKAPNTEFWFEDVSVSPQFFAGITQQDLSPRFAVWVDEGATEAEISDLVDSDAFFDEFRDRPAEIRAGLRPDANSLRLLALIGSAIAVVVLGALLIQHLLLAADNNQTLRSLGATSNLLALATMLHASGLALGAGVAAAATALVAMPTIPLGAADAIDAGNGPPLVLGWALLDLALIPVLVLVLCAPISVLVSRGGRRSSRGTSASFVMRTTDRLSLGIPARLGLRIAFDVDRGERPVAKRAGMVALGLALLSLVAALTFSAGVDDLRSSPELVGQTFDGLAFIPESENDTIRLEDELNSTDVEWTFATLFPNVGTRIVGGPALGLTAFDVGGGIDLAMIDGEVPRSSNEIVLDVGVARPLGLGPGATISVEIEHPLLSIASAVGDAPPFPRFVDLTVSGTAVLFGFTGPDQGLGVMTFEGIGALTPVDGANAASLAAQATGIELDEETASVLDDIMSTPIEDLDQRFTVAPQVVLVDADDPQTARNVIVELGEAGLVDEQFDFGGPDDEADLLEGITGFDLRSSTVIPRTIGVLMVLAAIAVLAHVVAVNTISHRRDLAILGALGARRSLMTRVVVWQSIATFVAPMVIAVPLGAVAGRAMWLRYIEDFRVIPRAVTPWYSLGALALAGAVAAVVIAGAFALRLVKVDVIARLHDE